ncbi:OmpA family protein [Aureimonas endophytica]|nr:OmpA family protein [Aureimonas endophytica]
MLSGTERPARADPAYTAADVMARFEGQGPVMVRRGVRRSDAACPSGSACPAKPGFDLVITFALGSDRLSPQAKENLDQFALALEDPRLAAERFLIAGHTDARGSASGNLALSIRRAEAVAAYLAERGVASTRLSTEGFGSTMPRTPDAFDPINRRVEANLRR